MGEVKVLPYNAEHITSYTRTHNDYRHRSSPLATMGPSFMNWDQDGSAGRFTIDYEEVIFVVDGELTLTVHHSHRETEIVRGRPGDVIAVSAGSDLDYSAIRGTRLFVVFSPLNWEDLLAKN